MRGNRQRLSASAGTFLFVVFLIGLARDFGPSSPTATESPTSGATATPTQLATPSCQDVRYPSRGSSVRATLCRPPGSSSVPQLPGIVVLYGCGGPPGLPETHNLASYGFVVLDVDYFSQTPSPSTNPPGIFCSGSVSREARISAARIWLANISDAVTWLQHVDGVHPTQIGIIGWSLGGDVAIAAAAADPRIRALVSYAGYSTFATDDLRANISALPQMLMLNGESDVVTTTSDLAQFRALLDRFQKYYEFYIYPGGDHSWAGVQGVEGMKRTAAFLHRFLS